MIDINTAINLIKMQMGTIVEAVEASGKYIFQLEKRIEELEKCKCNCKNK